MDDAGTPGDPSNAPGTTDGTDTARTSAAGTNAAGTDTAGTNAAGTDTAGTNAAGTDTAGTNTAETNAAGTDTAGTTAGGDEASGRSSPRRSRRWPRRLLIVANLVVFVTIAGAATVVGYASHQLNNIHRVGVGDLTPIPKAAPRKKGEPKPPSISPFTILIVGDDSRALGGKVHGVGNSSTNPEDLSDSIILARVDPAEHRLALLSIPRDLYVAIPGIGTAKINAAFSGGDPTRLIRVITDELHIPINHYAALNFYTFEQVADAIGGVEQYFPTPASDVESGLQIPRAGCVDLKGERALGFVRSRNYFYELNGVFYNQLSPESDLGRIQRQQAFIKNAIRKVERSGDLTDPITLNRLLTSVTKNLTLDTEFSDQELIDLTEDFAHLDANSVPNLTYPVVNSGDGLARRPRADAAIVKKFETLGVTTTKKTAKSNETTTTLPRLGTAYSSGTAIVPSASSFYHGVYIPPGRVPGQKVETCGN